MDDLNFIAGINTLYSPRIISNLRFLPSILVNHLHAQASFRFSN